MERTWKPVEVERFITIPFDWRDPTPGGSNLGRAEFHVCLIFKRGKLQEFFVYPTQLHMDTYWHMSNPSFNDFTIHSYDNLDNANTWMATYCKEHKAFMLAVYAPTNAKYLRIDSYGLTFTAKAVQ